MPESQSFDLGADHETSEQPTAVDSEASPAPARGSGDGMSDLRRRGWAVGVWVNLAGRVYAFRDRWVDIDVASGIVEVSERGGGRHQVTAPIGSAVIEWDLGDRSRSEAIAAGPA